jgi:fructokinase
MSSTPSDAVIVWGEILWDRFEHGDELGGAPANVAWHLGLAGGWPRLVSRVGDDDAGRRAIARLGEVVDADLVQLDRERPTGEVRVEVVGGEPKYRLVPGCAWEAIQCTADVRRALGEAGVLVFGSLAQRSEPALGQWRDAVAAAAATCVKVCDVNLRAGDGDASHVRAALDAADVVKVNDRELALLADWRGWADPISELRRRRAKILAVTHGAAGSTLFGDGHAIEIPGEPAGVGGDHVGCGDAYLAILVHGMTCGWDLETSGRAASRWAAAVAGMRGATPWFSEEQAADLLEAA